MIDAPAMPRYSFTLGDGAPVADSDATADFASNKAATDHAGLVAKDLARSISARNLCVVARDESGNKIVSVPVAADQK
jgi:hypothetical protein